MFVSEVFVAIPGFVTTHFIFTGVAEARRRLIVPKLSGDMEIMGFVPETGVPLLIVHVYVAPEGNDSPTLEGVAVNEKPSVVFASL